ncbi:hypothetical protein D915_005397 [Fasciola hepatica]|uniref:Tetraspanin n=1 Tax=Fasciola hepatica TaxID=6192 RepID=A0A4E0R8B5_FASHE|nr:hypothetical protein D915_005397 [Fasciola hepatica]
MSTSPYGCLFLGVGLIGLGSFSLTQNSGYVATLGPDLAVLPSLLIFLGALIILLSGLAIAGSVKPHGCLLICYSGLLFVIMLGELALGVVAIAGRETMQKRIQVEMVRAMSHYNSQVQTRFGVDMIQRRGCWSALITLARSNEGMFAGVVLSVCFLQILGILFGFLLAHRVRHPPGQRTDSPSRIKSVDDVFFEDKEVSHQ